MTPYATELAAGIRRGHPRSVARAISLVERRDPSVDLIIRQIGGATLPAHVVGITGAPGAGKSTTVSALTSAYREIGWRVGVLAVDPSSPFTGGALLGDRIRMRDHALDPEVFIRSMASQGHLGGLSAAVPQALRILEGAGCRVVLIETVGVGQSEVEVSGVADTTVVVLTPGMGDGIQASKAGVLEIGDIFAVNKSDVDGASTTVRDIQRMIALDPTVAAATWRRPVVRTRADTGDTGSLMQALTDRWEWLQTYDALTIKRVARTALELEARGLDSVREDLRAVDGEHALDALAAAVTRGELDPAAAASLLRQRLSG